MRALGGGRAGSEGEASMGDIPRKPLMASRRRGLGLSSRETQHETRFVVVLMRPLVSPATRKGPQLPQTRRCTRRTSYAVRLELSPGTGRTLGVLSMRVAAWPPEAKAEVPLDELPRSDQCTPGMYGCGSTTRGYEGSSRSSPSAVSPPAPDCGG